MTTTETKTRSHTFENKVGALDFVRVNPEFIICTKEELENYHRALAGQKKKDKET